MFKSFKLVALIFIDIYCKLAFIPHWSITDNQKQFAEEQAYQNLTECRVYDTNYKRQPSLLNQLGSLTMCL